MFLQLVGTAIGMEFAPSYTFLRGNLEEIILFPELLPSYFKIIKANERKKYEQMNNK